MAESTFDKKAFKSEVVDNVKLLFRKTIEEADISSSSLRR